MPEYLAPAVYVEEVSFRPKPLEGVSTSTTAFVGPTATGPIDDVPELLTGVGDFERIYGGTARLSFGVNYLAHAVRAFFDNGGRRLYVTRAFQPGTGTGTARLSLTAAISFVARFPGAAGNGRLQLREERTPTTRAALDRAQPGTMIRIGVDQAATPATALGGVAPFVVPNNAAIQVTVGAGAPATFTFRGQSATVSAAPTFPLALASGGQLRLNISGVIQTVVFAAGTTFPTLASLATAINRELVGGFAEASGTDLVIGSEVRGTASSIAVLEGTALGFTNGQSATEAGDVINNTVPNIGKVTAADLAALLSTSAVTVTTGLDSRVRISTSAVGTGATLTLANVGTSPSAAAAMGFAVGAAPPGTGTTAVQYFVKRGTTFVDSANAPLPADPLNGVEFLSLNVVTIDGDGRTKNFEDLAYDPAHPRYVGAVLGTAPPRRSDFLENRFAIDTSLADTTAVTWPFTLRAALLPLDDENLIGPLVGGNDGAEPTGQRFTDALQQLRSIEDISIVAAPGSSALLEATAIRAALITHVERRRSYQIAVLDPPPQSSIGEVRTYRADIDSKYAALYYPWVRVANPDLRPGDITTPRELDVPPSGFVCGIYARNDTERGVHKAPANEVVRGALSLESFVNFSQQEVLNPSGINAIRFFPGRGIRVWGARLVSSDPEWKYVSARRYFNYVEASIDRGTQYVVFEPNGPQLWARIRSSVSDFLFTEWRNGALLGAAPAEAFFVRCDRTTMTQNDLDNGRLIVEIGIAIVNPAEFVIFRIGQKTSDARS